MLEILTNHQNEIASFALLCLGVCLVSFEVITGRLTRGKTKEDWKMSGISLAGLVLAQRPLVMLIVLSSMAFFLNNYEGYYTYIEEKYFAGCLVAFLMIDELLHGSLHRFAHARTPNNLFAAKIQGFVKVAHRPHHLNGGSDDKGQLGVINTYIENWLFLFILPNYWFGFALLYLGFYDTFLWGTVIKSVWALHVHTNWNYDLYFLNHKNPIIRKSMFALCHVFTFPTMHHQHHSRSKNSAKNMQNMLALYDWLLWKTLVIENQRPEIYGWRQTEKEAHNIWYRYFSTSPERN